MARFVFGDRSFECPVALCLDVIGGKWAALILWHLRDATLRYSELQRRLPSISQKMLAQRLRELEADGLVHRTVYPVVPPRTEYALSDEGRRVLPALRAMQQWGLRYKATAPSAGSE